MSGYPGQPQRFPPPPGVSGGPPPPGGGYGGFPPPSGQRQQTPPGTGGGFPPPPPPGQHQQQPPVPGGFAPAPPAGGVQQINQGMQGMNLQQQQQPMQQPKPPAAFPGARAPPPPGAGQLFGTPPPQDGGSARNMFRPTTGGAAAAPPPPRAGLPGARPPGMMATPPSAGGGRGAPPPPGQAPGGASFYGSGGQANTPAPPRMAGTPQPGAAPTAGAQQQPSYQFQENVDFNIQIPKSIFRLSTSKIPVSNGLATQTKTPMGAIIRPLAPPHPDEDLIDTVQPGNAGIIRCKRCRTYINAFVSWLDNGRRWRCNICAQLNETSSSYFCHLDENGQRRDRLQRPELSKSIVEFVAPAEYMVRPPQEPSYFFVLDVSATAAQSGMLAHAATAIKKSLDNLPGRTRTKIGFITYDNSVHYYSLAPDLQSPQMMVVSDLKELFVPAPDHLLVNLRESRKVVDSFLDSLPDMFSKRPVAGRSCLGPALKAAFTVLKPVGGKMCVFQSIMPNMGDGTLRPRENPGIMGTPAEVKLIRPDISWYKETAVEFSRQQISVDMFLFPYQYMDMAALGELPKYTAGSLKSYVNFNSKKDGARFECELHKTLTTKTAFESVMRIRCTKGMRITNFFGNFNIRGTDLLALPNCNTDSVFGFDLAHDEQSLQTNAVTIQAALLYTSSEGERRIRVMTQALPVVSLGSDVIKSVDAEAMSCLLAKQALEVSLKSNIDNARMKMQQALVEMVRAAKDGDKRTVSGYQVPPPGVSGQAPQEEDNQEIPENLKLLPLYTLAMMKNVAFRGGTDIHPDERVQARHTIGGLFVKDSTRFIYPRMFSLHDMTDGVGRHSEDNSNDSEYEIAGRDRIMLPDVVNLSVDRLSSNGIFLLDNGIDMNIWVGRSADPQLISALFGVENLEQHDISQISLQTTGDDFAVRVSAITEALRQDDADPYTIVPRITIIREGDASMESRFFWFMVEDGASFQGGTYNYSEFMDFVKNSNVSAPAAGPGGGPGGMGGRGGPPPPPGGPGGIGGSPPPGPLQGGMPPPPGPSTHSSSRYGASASAGPPSGGPPLGPPPPAGPPSGGGYSALPLAGPPSGGGYAPPPPVAPHPGGYGVPRRGAPPSGGYGAHPPTGTPSGGHNACPPPSNYGGMAPPPPPGHR